MSRTWTDEERRILSHHVSNLDRDVYAVFNLPPEVVAVVFAYVSRSPASFRENLLKLVLSGDLGMEGVVGQYRSSSVDLEAAREKAREFHERWTVAYGHSSVAELSNLALGVERISRLASAELELANRWLSFIEYSQRYQRPRRGAFVTPPELAGEPRAIDAFTRLQELTFDAYERLMQGLLPYLNETVPRADNESDDRFRRRIEKVAFEDARYALTLAIQTNLGMTGNARALRDAIVRLLSDPYRETSELAGALRDEGRKICPALIRYAEPNPYRQQLWHRLGAGNLGDNISAEPGTDQSFVFNRRGLRLVDWTGRTPREAPLGGLILPDTAAYMGTYQPGIAPPASEVPALRRVLAAAASSHGQFTTEEALAGLSAEQLLHAYRQLLAGLGPHDHPPEALLQVSYTFELCISEANWHQFLRHSRQIDFYPERPTIDAGHTVPPNVEHAGLAPILDEAVNAAAETFRRLAAVSPFAAHYTVTNAHHRRVRARVTLWEMLHLLNLRGKPDAQWDIRQTVLAMRDLIRRVHPHLLEVQREPETSRDGVVPLGLGHGRRR